MSPGQTQEQPKELTPDEARLVLKAIEEAEREEAEQQAAEKEGCSPHDICRDPVNE